MPDLPTRFVGGAAFRAAIKPLKERKTRRARYPRRPDPIDVRILADGLESLALAVSAALTGHAESKKMSGSAAQADRHIQSSNPDTPVIERASGDRMKPPPVSGASSVPPAMADCAIRSTYPLSSVLDACPQVQDFSPTGIRSWDDLIETADRIRPMLGISPTAWGDAQDAMGIETAAITLAAILERSERIKNAGGYLRALTERKQAGTYSLGPVLQALRRAQFRPQEARQQS